MKHREVDWRFCWKWKNREILPYGFLFIIIKPNVTSRKNTSVYLSGGILCHHTQKFIDWQVSRGDSASDTGAHLAARATEFRLCQIVPSEFNHRYSAWEAKPIGIYAGSSDPLQWLSLRISGHSVKSFDLDRIPKNRNQIAGRQNSIDPAAPNKQIADGVHKFFLSERGNDYHAISFGNIALSTVNWPCEQFHRCVSAVHHLMRVLPDARPAQLQDVYPQGFLL